MTCFLRATTKPKTADETCGVLVCPSSRRFNTEKTSNREHGFPVVWPGEQSQLNHDGKPPGDIPSENEDLETRQSLYEMNFCLIGY